MNKTILVTAALTGLMLTACASNPTSSNSDSSAAAGECHGVNACKGQGECGGPGHACAGKNSCKGQGWVKLSKADCDQKSGTFKPSAM